ncbi:MAG TPA: AI-2E family transporter [Candidatus Sulfotelmatobacter sp.]|nr:AI-2E family transporter [Candidatus Sulfotelmatobacter sp.]
MSADPTNLRPRRRVSRAERNVTFWLKTLGLIAVAIYLTVGVLEFLGNVKATALLFVVALFFAYMIFPLVRRLNERLPLGVAVLLVYLLIAIVGAAILQLLIPPLVSDMQSVAKALPGLVTRYSLLFADPHTPVLRWLTPSERGYLATIPAQIQHFITVNAFSTATKTLAVVLSTISVIATIVVVPVLAAYMLLDAENLKKGFLAIFPTRGAARHKAEVIIGELDSVVGGFIRGQLIDGSILGAMLTLMLFVMHVPYALLIGVVSGALNFIPYAGAVVAFVPAVALAFAYNGPINALVVAGLIALIHQIDGNFIAPRVLKENVGLSPFWILLAILGGSELFGLVGTFLAVPAAAMIRVVLRALLPHPVSRTEAQPAVTKEPRDETALPKEPARSARRARRP